jgi:kinesin family protein 3/17
MQAKSELTDINEEHQRAKESLLESIRESTKDLKLKSLVINAYIPIEFQVGSFVIQKQNKKSPL